MGVNPEPFLLRESRQSFYNTSPLDMKKLMGDPDHIRDNLYSYIQAFSPAVRDIFDRFELHIQIERLHKAGLLYQVAEKFANTDLHPERVDNHQMGLVFEELIRKFAEISNETAGSTSLRAKSSGLWSICCSSKMTKWWAGPASYGRSTTRRPARAGCCRWREIISTSTIRALA